jgi:succinate dehydrogenase / fumarate reductase flavoprotein subunit
MYYKIVDEDPYKTNDDLSCCTLYDGWNLDYNLQTTIPGCFSIGESNFSSEQTD